MPRAVVTAAVGDLASCGPWLSSETGTGDPCGTLGSWRDAAGPHAVVDHELVKDTGLTTGVGQGRFDAPAWHRPGW